MNLIKKKGRTGLFLAGILSFMVASAQEQKMDSLQTILQHHISEDTLRVNTLNELAHMLYSQAPEKAKAYAEESGQIAVRIDYPKGEAASLWVMGLTSLNDKKLALTYFQKALSISKKARDKVGICNYLIAIGNIMIELGDIKASEESASEAFQIAETLNNKLLMIKTLYCIARNQSIKGDYKKAAERYREVICIADEIDNKKMIAAASGALANIYTKQGNFPRAIELYFSALKINEEQNHKIGVFTNLNNIASVQAEQKDFEAALKTFQKAFELSKEMNDSLRISVSLANMGSICLDMKKTDALHYFQKSLVMGENRDFGATINALANIGGIYIDRAELDSAQHSLDKALKLVEHSNFNYGYGKVWLKVGLLHLMRKEYRQATEYTQKALQLAKKIRYLKLEKDCYKQLADIYASTGAFEKAYREHVHYKAISDSLFSEENIREITRLESSYQYDKERQQQMLETANQMLEIKNQRQVILFLVLISVLILVLVFVLYWANRLKKNEIKSKNHELEMNQKAMTAATLKLVQNAERDSHSIKMLESIKKNTADEGLAEIRTLITNYKLKSSNSNWEEFEIMFEKVDSSFYAKLNEQFPTLTPNERKLCVFLKLNMSNNHISQITFQSEEALKKARLRLRKKLGIKRHVNLTTFIQNL